MTEEVDLIRQHAVLLIQRGEDAQLRARYLELLQDCQDRPGLEELGEQLSYSPGVAVPLYERILALDSSDVAVVLKLGHLHFIYGEDEAAGAWLDRAREAEGETVRVLRLAANLAREDQEKKRIYTQILDLEPGNRAAFEHLLALRKGKN